MMPEEITVSICCTAYNHEKYIAEALESFISQQTDFKYHRPRRRFNGSNAGYYSGICKKISRSHFSNISDAKSVFAREKYFGGVHGASYARHLCGALRGRRLLDGSAETEKAGFCIARASGMFFLCAYHTGSAGKWHANGSSFSAKQMSFQSVYVSSLPEPDTELFVPHKLVYVQRR